MTLSCTGAMDYLRSNPEAGPLVRMIIAVSHDIKPFLGVLWYGVLYY